jgi:outer membrane protein assembly factor BamD
MSKMNKIATIFLMTLLLVSCGEYHKVLNKGTIEEQYKLATTMYDAKSYSKAIQLFEKITPGFRGKPQMERIQFMISDAYYQSKQFHLSSYYFDRFAKNYPKSTKKEEAAYLGAHSYYLDSPTSSLDQTATDEALSSMQQFMDTYPESDRIVDANNVVQELRYKKETKAFDTAYQYYHIEDYTAAIASFDNLIGDYLGTKYREQAMFLKFDSAYLLGVGSVPYKKEKRINTAIAYFEKFEKSYPESEFLKNTDKKIEKLNKELVAVQEMAASILN